jgi:putative transcriptional regulator
MGKRGGLRIIYYWEELSETFYRLTLYRKNDQEDLTPKQIAIMRRLVQEGIQVKQKDFDRLVASVKQAGGIRRGQLKPGRVTEFRPEDVRAIRGKLEKSQEEFALMIGVSVATLQNWEQGRRRPEGPARALLRVAAKNPQAVAKALAS